MTTILIADDEKRVRDGIRLTLSDEPYDLIEAADLEQAYAAISAASPDLVLLDVHFQNGQTCISLLERLRQEDVTIPIIVLSGAASAKEAADAIRLGAYDFLEKPVGAERLRISLQNALVASSNQARAKAATVVHNAASDLIGTSQAIQKVRDLINQFGRRDAKVLITGETGTGKELVAHGIWRASLRRDRPFVVVNSAAIPESLIESELFGHKKGSFTGATANQMGKIEMADGGTLFLDEIGELSLAAQSKLLRFLETGEIQILGSGKTTKCDVRLVAATSRDLQQEMKAGRFREDLYFRINVARIEIPKLRDRPEDIFPIFDHFISAITRRYNEPVRKLTDGARKLLAAYAWPGNVRELRNVAERLVLLSLDTITPELVQEILGVQAGGNQVNLGGGLSGIGDIVPLKEYRKRLESKYIEQVLALVEGSVTRAAQLLEVDRSHLHQKLKELGIG